MKEFLEAIFSNYLKQHNGFIEVKVINPGRVQQRFFKDLDELISFAEANNENIFFSVCPRAEEKGTADTVRHVVGLWADVDYGVAGHRKNPKYENREDAEKVINNFFLPPSIVVDSGHGFHCYWLLHEIIEISDKSTQKIVEATVKGINEVLGGDSVQDLSRVFRLPVTTNQKYDENKNKLEAKRVTVVTDNSRLKYSFDDFKSLRSDSNVSSNDNSEMSFSELNAKVDVDTLSITKNIRDLIKFGDTKNVYQSRSECDEAVIVGLLSSGYGADVVKSVFSDENLKIGEKYREERARKGNVYLIKSIEKGLKLLNKSTKETSPILDKNIIPDSGFLGEYIKFASEITEAPVQFHVATALAIASICVGRKVYVNRGHKKIYPNFWIIVFGESGSSKKSTSQEIAQEILMPVNDKLIGPDEFSKEGFIKVLANQPALILFQSEFSNLLSVMEKKYNDGLKTLLTNLFDCPEKLYQRTIKNESMSIEYPFLNILGGTTREWFVKSLKEEDLRSGFLSRFIFITASKKEKIYPFPDPAKKKTVNSVVKLLRQISKRKGEMRLSDEAMKEYKAWYIQKDKDLENEPLKNILGSFYSRICDYVLKISIIYALNNKEKVISLTNLQKAIVLAEYLIKSTKYYVLNELTFNVFSEKKHKIIRLIKEAGGKISRSVLIRYSNEYSKDLNPLIETLKESAEVYEKKIDGTTFYFLAGFKIS